MTDIINEKDAARLVENFTQKAEKLNQEIGKLIVGQKETIKGTLICLFVGGHGLLEGVPGLGKTILVKTLSQTLNLCFNRIQFTPDLMPADIIGTTVITERESRSREFEFKPGPIFSNIVLADEINRATPKTQSALLEAMQEKCVTVSNVTHKLDEPFLVLATQNPLEMEGTYPLPEAQLDRFLFKINVHYPSAEEMEEILNRTTGSKDPELNNVMTKDELIEMKNLVRMVPVPPHINKYVVKIIEATHPKTEIAPPLCKKYVKYGSSPRGAQSILLASKTLALIEGRFSPSRDDVKKVAPLALRHRLILSFEGEAEGIKSDEIISEIIDSITIENV